MCAKMLEYLLTYVGGLRSSYMTVQFANGSRIYPFPNPLKVPKCENFHRTDFFDFFTIKPLWVGDFRAKI